MKGNAAREGASAFPQDALSEMVRALGAALTARGICCAVAESCTGGLLGAALTSLPGASAWFAGGVIAYDDRIKSGLLNVAPEILRADGAVSEPAALAMASGACRLFEVPAALAVTGIAGPEGGGPGKPVGLVWIACALHDRVQARSFVFPGGRNAVRSASCREAAGFLLARLS
jgi:nicotinamide-nucleotide amidase